MTEKAIQWQVQDMLKRIERLQYEIERGITADGTDEQRLIFLQSTIDEFQNLSSLKTDLTYEVATNISKGLRPAQELTYLESLEELLEYIDYTYTLVEKQDWEDTILDRLMILSGRIYIGANKAVRLQERDKELIVILIEQVRASCYELDKECIEIAKLALKSWFIQEHPEKFSHIVSYIPIEKPTTKNDPPTSIATLAQPSVEESIPSNNEFPDAQTLEPTTKLQWRDNRGDKTDFAELVWTLAKSHRIIDSKTGKPVTIDVLANQLGGLFSISVNNPMQLMQGRKDSYKATEDGITFIASLSELVEKYIANK